MSGKPIATPARATTLTGDRGISLVEATIILMVLAMLTAVIAPTAGNYIEDTRQVAAKEDVEAIGTAVINLLRDTGSRCLRLAGTTECTVTNRVDLLVSAGNNPVAVTAANVTLPDSDSANTEGGAGVVNWLPSTSDPPQFDTMDAQLVQNSMATPYAAASFTSGGGPRMKLGWRGAYLNGTIDVDPWGYAYQANTVFLAVASDATDGTSAGERRGGWTSDVMVISSGSNGAMQTAFGATGAAATGDDIIAVVQGATR